MVVETNNTGEDMSASFQSDCSYSLDDDENRSQQSGSPSNDNDDDDDDDDDETVLNGKKNNNKNKNNHDSDNVMDQNKQITNTTARVKLGVFLALSAFALLISLLVALISLQWEMQAFHQAFAGDATRLFQHVAIKGQENVEAMASFGTFLTSYATGAAGAGAGASGAWPFVTVPNAMLESQGAHVMHILNTSQLYVSPFVQAGVERQAWETYTNEQAREMGLTPRQISKSIFKILPNSLGIKVPEDNDAAGPPFSPVWQIVPTTADNLGDIKYNLASLPSVADAVNQVYTSEQAVMTPPVPLNEMEASITEFLQLFNVTTMQASEPVSLLLHPVFDDLESSMIVAVAVAPFVWSSYLTNAFGPGTRGIVTVFNSACGEKDAASSTNTSTFTYEINENQAMFMGTGDKHHKYFDDTAQSGTVASLIQGNGNDGSFETSDGISLNQEYCPMTITCYASAIYMNQRLTSGPIWSTATVIVVFTIVLLLFLVYGGYTEDRLNTLTKRAQRTTRLVNTLFPKEIQDRMFKNDNDEADEADDMEAALLTQNGNGGGGGGGVTPDPLSKIKTFLKDKQGDANKENDMPIADLYPNCTVLFADLVGFTAWSSGREPAQVFILLEKVYKSFDDIAKRRGVFKVETIGDCYVAVCGLPTPNKSHAVVMTRFARDCRDKMVKVARDLEVTLGPGTGDLQLRIGLHSGPVTAGVLRGERSRFQLFGDTVNTTARVESSGWPQRIHVSSSTAELLIAAGKQNWLMEREELVEAKGKGKLKTYWADPKSSATTASLSSGVSISSSGASEDNEFYGEGEYATATVANKLVKIDNKTRRLVDWNVQVLAQLIRKIVAYRATYNQANNKNNNNKTSATIGGDHWFSTDSTNPLKGGGSGAKKTVIDEVREVIDMPEGDATLSARTKDDGELSDVVMQQLDQLVACIASKYPQHSFHNFDHASGVTMSTVKLLSRIIAPSNSNADEGNMDISSLQATLANNPLTQFACVFSALTHDVNHPGVSNMILVKENSPLARAYKNKSVAEQNSIDIAWDLLMQDTFRDLRHAICATDRELRQFRQLVVNAVMATDIMDADLKALRNKRWERAFGGDQGADVGKEAVNRKATIVIEHLIQASDVSHTMQHWHIYRKWNEKLFREMYKAYKEGRIDRDPAANWHAGEIGFFDFYIIPLAKKLSDCGVFGVSSDEYLSYAKSNRQEWEQRGQEIVAEMVEKVNNEQACRSAAKAKSKPAQNLCNV